MRSFAFLTKQAWKYRIHLVLTTAAVIMTAAQLSLWTGNPLQLPVGMTVALFFAMCIPSFLWVAFAIKCPRCRTSLGWYHMTHGPAHDAELRIDASVTCPACEFNPLDVLDRNEVAGIE